MGWEDEAWAIFMCFEHERIHLETSSVLIRELPLHCVRHPEYLPPYHPSTDLPSAPMPTPGADYPPNTLLTVRGEAVVLGKPLEYPSFGFDCEYGRKRVDVPTFRASRFKVTNGEFFDFVRAGGYNSLKYWSAEGWGWRTFRNVKYPTFWVLDGPQARGGRGGGAGGMGLCLCLWEGGHVFVFVGGSIPVALLVERSLNMREVVGSIPAGSPVRFFCRVMKSRSPID